MGTSVIYHLLAQPDAFAVELGVQCVRGRNLNVRRSAWQKKKKEKRMTVVLKNQVHSEEEGRRERRSVDTGYSLPSPILVLLEN